MVVLSDRKYPIQSSSTTGSIAFYQPDVRSANDYYAFGGLMPGRKWDDPEQLGVYRFGINGQLKDNEIYGEGNAFSAEFWEYDTRLGRRWNVDPIFKEWESSYAVFGNNPVWLSDPDGLDTTKCENGDNFPENPCDGDVAYTENKDGKYSWEYKDGKWQENGGYKDLPELIVKPEKSEEEKKLEEYYKHPYVSYGWTHAENQAFSKFLLAGTLTYTTFGLGGFSLSSFFLINTDYWWLRLGMSSMTQLTFNGGLRGIDLFDLVSDASLGVGTGAFLKSYFDYTPFSKLEDKKFKSPFNSTKKADNFYIEYICSLVFIRINYRITNSFNELGEIEKKILIDGSLQSEEEITKKILNEQNK